MDAFSTLTCREAATPFTAESQHSADLQSLLFLQKTPKHLPQQTSQCCHHGLTFPEGLSVAEERGQQEGIPPKHKPRCLWDNKHPPGSTHSPPVLEYSVVFRTDFAIVSRTCFCGGKNPREPVVTAVSSFCAWRTYWCAPSAWPGSSYLIPSCDYLATSSNNDQWFKVTYSSILGLM